MVTPDPKLNIKSGDTVMYKGYPVTALSSPFLAHTAKEPLDNPHWCVAINPSHNDGRFIERLDYVSFETQPEKQMRENIEELTAMIENSKAYYGLHHSFELTPLGRHDSYKFSRDSGWGFSSGTDVEKFYWQVEGFLWGWKESHIQSLENSNG